MNIRSSKKGKDYDSNNTHVEKKEFSNRRVSGFKNRLLLCMAVFLFIIQAVLTPLFMGVKPAHAFMDILGPGEFGIVEVDIPRDIEYVKKKAEDGIMAALKKAALIALKNGLKTFLTKIAYDTAVWIGSGDKNQKPLLFTKDWGSYLEDAGDAALGDFLQTLGQENGFINFNLCDPYSNNIRLKIQLGLEFAVSKPRKPQCTFSQMRERWDQAIEDPKFLDNFSVSFDPVQNDTGLFLSLQTSLIKYKAEQEDLAAKERQPDKPVKDLKGAVSKYIETPGAMVQNQIESMQESTTKDFLTFVGDPVADAMNVFTSTLVSKWMSRLKSGFWSLADLKKEQQASGSGGCFGLFCSSSGGSAPGIAASKSQFASLGQPSFTTSEGDFVDLLGEFVSCPSTGATTNNCIIDQGFRTAIEQGLTVREALDQGLLDGSKPFAYGDGGTEIVKPNQGYSHRAMIVLKKYLVVPVGWQIAAEYMRDYDTSNHTINELVDKFNKCDAQNYTPYCGLIDPNWVLKIPGNYCKKYGYSDILLMENYVDNDGNINTPKAKTVTRQEMCIEDQSCIQEKQDGSCKVYGYCTQQRRTWKFVGDMCKKQFNSCVLFESTADRSEQPLLASTINFDACNGDVAGCKWYCSKFNTVNQDWQCRSDGLVYPTCTSNTCTATMYCNSSCQVEKGAFRCTNPDGEYCYFGIPALDNAIAGNDASINLDRDAKACDETAAGCSEFIQVKNGSNLISNSSFEFYNGDDTDADPDLFGFCDGKNGDDKACRQDSDCAGECVGWQRTAGLQALSTRDQAVFDQHSVKIKRTTGGLDSEYFQYEYDSNNSLDNRSFYLSLQYRNDGSQDCKNKLSFSVVDTTGTEQVYSEEYVLTHGTDEWLSVQFPSNGKPFTIPNNFTGTNDVLTARISQPTTSAGQDCEIYVDAAQLEEVKPLNYESKGQVAQYGNYSSMNKLYMTSNRKSCETKDIGCQSYTDMFDGTVIPAKVTNPVSEKCGDAASVSVTDRMKGFDKNYSKASCSQCDAGNVGCDFYEEQPLAGQPPDPKIAWRTGKYCIKDQTTSCFNDSDCGGVSGSCQNRISIVPTTGKVCEAQFVGCEQYTNLDQVASGGEGIEYYYRIKQCVKPEATSFCSDGVTACEYDSDCASGTCPSTQATYYTYIGSDTAGYQLKQYKLKKSNKTNYNGETGVAPCTNLKFGSESDNADCVDVIQDNPALCTEINSNVNDASYNPDCGQFYDNANHIFYRLRSRVITVSDDCHPLRNTTDSQIYYSIPGESLACPAQANGCREYKGNAGNNLRIVMNEDFEKGSVWENGVPSSDTVSGQGQSMFMNNVNGDKVYTGVAQVNDAGNVITNIVKGNAYIVTFWAKSGSNVRVVPFFAKDNVFANMITFNAVEIAGGLDWNFYKTGPIIFDRDVSSTEIFGLQTSIAGVTIDNIRLTDNASQYLIKGTSKLCPNFEGCREYADASNKRNYIKSFEHICEQKAVGCEAVIDTQNSSDTPYAEQFFTANTPPYDSDRDDTIVFADSVTTVVNDKNNYCRSFQKGCTKLGMPVLSADGIAQSYKNVALMNNPDTYETTLCANHHLMCQEYTAHKSSYYFKDPGEKTCEYKEADQSVLPEELKGKSVYRWFKKGTNDECPLYNDDDPLSKPMGSICRGGSLADQPCQKDSDCPDGLCSSTESMSNGWTGSCPADQDGCTLYYDTYGENPTGDQVENSGFENDVENNNTGAATSDGLPDKWGKSSDCSDDSGKYYSSQSRTDTRSLLMKSNASCEWNTKKRIEVDANSVYTLRVYAKSQNGTEKMNLGLRFYSGATLLEVADCGRFAACDGDNTWANIAANELIPSNSNWQLFQGNIGPGEDIGFPEGTTHVEVYINKPSATPGAIYIDDLTFDHSDEYYYIRYSVDGDPASEVNSCNSEPNLAERCVVLRESAETNQTYRADDPRTEINESKQIEAGVDVQAENCKISSPTNSEQCRTKTNTASGNLVIKVRPDRTCSEWLACQSQRNAKDADGNTVPLCFGIARCRGLSESGLCNQWMTVPFPEQVNVDDVKEFYSTGGNTEELTQIQNLTGYTKAGIRSLSRDNSDQYTINRELRGYYSYDIMPQLGVDGAQGTKELVPNWNLEDVTCRSGVVGAKCTKDQHCQDVTVEDGGYEDDWCLNPPYKWFATSVNNTSSKIVVIDYQDNIELDDTNDLDLNNVMQVEPSGNESNGVRVSLEDKIYDGGEYVISFDAKYDGAPTETDRINVAYVYNGNLGVCEGGSKNNKKCYTDRDCPSGSCKSIGICSKGTNNGKQCFDNGDCPDGTCSIGPGNMDIFSKTCSGGKRDGLFCMDTESVCKIPGMPEKICDIDYTDCSTSAKAFQCSSKGGTCETNEPAGKVCDSQSVRDECEKAGGACDESVSCPDGTCVNDGLKFTTDWKRYTFGPMTVKNIATTPTFRCNNNYDQTCTGDSDCYDYECFDGDKDGSDCTKIVENVSGPDSTVCTGSGARCDQNLISSEMCIPISETSLHITQATDSFNTKFLIDDVSLKPVLEVNEYLEPISRECRGYPQEDSLECDYKDQNGIIQKGWKGYCIERDPSNSGRCITWWPVDVLLGESDLFARKRAGYKDRVPLWMCLVSRGNVSRKVCDDPGSTQDGKFCNSTNDCENPSTHIKAPCIAGVSPDTSKYKLQTRHIDLNPELVCTNQNRQETFYCSGDTGVCSDNSSKMCFGDDEDCYPTCNESSKECESCKGCNDTVCRDADDCKAAYIAANGSLPQCNVNSSYPDMESVCETDLGGKCQTLTPELDSARLYNWSANTLERSIYGHEIEKVFFDVGNAAGGHEEHWTKNGTSGYISFTSDSITEGCAKGGCWWHGGYPDPVGDTGGINDFMYVYGWSAMSDNIFTGTPPATDNEVTDAGSVYNPFSQWCDSLKPDRKLTSRENQSPLGGITLPGVKSITDCPNLEGGGVGSGGNLVALWLDFDENGKLANIFMIFHNGYCEGLSPMNLQNIKLTFMLRESCDYVVQVVDATGDNFAWADRTKSGSPYYLPDLLYNYYQDFRPFGGLAPATPPDSTPEYWDSRPNSKISEPPFVELPDDDKTDDSRDLAYGSPLVTYSAPEWQFRAGSPFACVGNCSIKVCDSGSKINQTCNKDSDCTDKGDKNNPNDNSIERCIGLGGICKDSSGMPIYNAGSSVPVRCNVGTACTGGTCVSAASGVGVRNATAADSYIKEVYLSAGSAAQKLSLVFVNILSAYQYDPGNHEWDDNGVKTLWADTSTRGAPCASQSCTMYETMPECPSAGRPSSNTAYCGVRPRIENFSINGTPEGPSSNVTIEENAAVNLTFTSVVDNEQLPLDKIIVNWDDGRTVPDEWESIAGEHIYSHNYACGGPSDTTSYNRYSKEIEPCKSDESKCPNVCEFNPKVRIIDNWEWCSGTEWSDDISHMDVRDVRDLEDYTGGSGDKCTSWDVFGENRQTDPKKKMDVSDLGIIGVKP